MSARTATSTRSWAASREARDDGRPDAVDRGHAPPLGRAPRRRPRGLGPAVRGRRAGRVRRRALRAARIGADRAHPRRQVDRAAAGVPPRRRGPDLEGRCGPPRLVLDPLDDRALRRQQHVEHRRPGRGDRGDGPRRPQAVRRRHLAQDPCRPRADPPLVGPDRRGRGVRGRALRRVRRGDPAGRAGPVARRAAGPAVREPALDCRRTQGPRAVRLPRPGRPCGAEPPDPGHGSAAGRCRGRVRAAADAGRGWDDAACAPGAHRDPLLRALLLHARRLLRARRLRGRPRVARPPALPTTPRTCRRRGSPASARSS